MTKQKIQVGEVWKRYHSHTKEDYFYVILDARPEEVIIKWLDDGKVDHYPWLDNGGDVLLEKQ